MSLQTVATAEIYAEALSRLTGTPATAVHEAKYSRVLFADPDATKAWIEKQLEPGKPGDVRVEFGPVVYPVAIKKALPWVLGLLVAGYVVGKVI